MSFGSLARRTPPDAPCPCGSAATFSGCCGAFLAGVAAPDAERLMRSRYTAFHEGDAAYLARTWHPRTRPDEITIDPELEWTGLVVESSTEDGDDATVRFRASWRQAGAAGVLAECSRFARRGGRWFYLDGDVD